VKQNDRLSASVPFACAKGIWIVGLINSSNFYYLSPSLNLKAKLESSAFDVAF